MKSSKKRSDRQVNFDLKQMTQEQNISTPSVQESNDSQKEKTQMKRSRRKRKYKQHVPQKQFKEGSIGKDIKEQANQQNGQNNNKCLQSFITQEYNSNKKSSSFILAIYLGLLLYTCYFYLLLIPSLIQASEMSEVTEVVLMVLFVIVVVLVVTSYQKARRLSPGYPIKIHQRYCIQKSQETPHIQEIEQLKNKNMQLLIKKVQLRQNCDKNPTAENYQKVQQFQYKFFVDEVKYCQKCKNVKDVRVRHCGECQRCVQRMDHHCVWLNNCVGKNNHKFFMLFLLFLLIALTFFTVVGAIDLMVKDGQLVKLIEIKYGPFWKISHLIALLLASLLWVYYMFVFLQQMYLISNNLTFVESLSKILNKKKPWKHHSLSQNLGEVFGPGCWVCPTGSKRNQLDLLPMMFKQQQNNKNPSVQLVEQILPGTRADNPTNFQSQVNFRHQKNQI